MNQVKFASQPSRWPEEMSHTNAWISLHSGALNGINPGTSRSLFWKAVASFCLSRSLSDVCGQMHWPILYSWWLSDLLLSSPLCEVPLLTASSSPQNLLKLQIRVWSFGLDTFPLKHLAKQSFLGSPKTALRLTSDSVYLERTHR